MTEWKELRGYLVSDDGQVIGHLGWRLKPRMTSEGYVAIGKCQAVHRLVCEAFHGPKPTPRHQAAHWNGIKTDNNASNLRWATPKENYADMIRHGRAAHGEKVGSSKLTAQNVQAIRDRRMAGERGVDLAREFGVMPNTIDRIVRRVTWSWLA